MADKDDEFKFEEEEESFLLEEDDTPEGEEEPFFEEEVVAEPPPAETGPLPRGGGEAPGPEPGRRSSLARILILLLVLVGVGAAALYYFAGPPESAPQAARDNRKQAIAVPAKPAPAPEKTTTSAESGPAPQTDQEPAGEPAEAAGEKQPEVTEPEKTAAKSPARPEVAAAGEGGEPAAPEQGKNGESPPAAGEQETVAAAGPSASGPATGEPAAEAPQDRAMADQAPSDMGTYRVQVGAVMLDSSLPELEEKVRELGFSPQVDEVTRQMKMTRLRVGTYPVEEARRRLDDLQADIPGAFLVIDGGQGTVYAGSYRVLDKARRAADLLYADGLRVEEEPVVVPVSMHRVLLGSFTERQKAEATASRARDAGLEALVLERP